MFNDVFPMCIKLMFIVLTYQHFKISVFIYLFPAHPSFLPLFPHPFHALKHSRN